MRLSVIVPVYNVEKYLPRCIDSIINQTFKDIEIILVNDGSTDNSLSICENYAIEDSRISIINKKNGGLSSSRNAGINVANGEYISFIDSDDWLQLNTYELIFNEMKKYDAYTFDVVNYSLKYAYDDVADDVMDEINGVCVFEGNDIMDKFFGLKGNVPGFSSCTKVYRRDVIDGIRFVEGRVSEDILFNYNVYSNAKYFLEIDAPFYRYYQRQGSISCGKLAKRSKDCLFMWDSINAQNKNDKYINVIKENKVSYMFSLLLRASTYGVDDAYEDFKIDKKAWLSYFRKNIKLILRSKKIAKAKKIAAIIMYVNYGLCGGVARLIGKKG